MSPVPASVITAPPVPLPPRVYGSLRRGGGILVEWPHPRRWKEKGDPGIYSGARRIEITPAHPGGRLQSGAHRIVTWPR